ncbi:CBS domain-containing protein [Methanococcus voltae]|uniref:CBS domain-containing protein n=2 Tax=Methanococcus voltae TaxID=2188 RepID=A0A8J7RMN1_METVO|nr:CBS domain-containing protein [Methanococcus voltae]MBP2201681.1 CBS domain-containing protein [Methanococcus voltae]MCS3922469.1 CBS domain-containing protein [Methanococcus voltae PS]
MEQLNSTIEEIMIKNVVSAKTSESVVDAFENMLKNKVSCLPIVNDDKVLMGIITTTDVGYNLIKDVYTLETTLEEVMTKDVISVKPSETIKQALQKMDINGTASEIINQLPVVDDDGKLIGIISDGDIIRYISKLI